MKLFILIVLLLLSSLLSGNEEHFQKLILSANQEEVIVKKDFLLLKKRFNEDARYKELKERHHLKMGIKKKEKFYLLSVYPIESLAVKNELLLLVQGDFSTPFIMDNVFEPLLLEKTKTQENKEIIEYEDIFEEIKIARHIAQKEKTKEKIEKEIKHKDYWFSDLQLEWLALWSLSVLGLILSIRSRRKLLYLAETQEEFNTWQEKIENEIQGLKGKND